MVTFGSATWRKVSPLWPVCPPGGLPDRSRRLRVRGSRLGFCSPSLDGGLPLLELFSPSRRSSSATRACNAAFSARRRSISATTAAGAAAVSGASSERRAFSGEVMDSLTHATIPASTPFLPWRTWAVPGQLRNFLNYTYLECGPGRRGPAGGAQDQVGTDPAGRRCWYIRGGDRRQRRCRYAHGVPDPAPLRQRRSGGGA